MIKNKLLILVLITLLLITPLTAIAQNQQPEVTIKIYRDNSVQVVITGTAENIGNSSGVIDASLTIKDKGFTAEASGSINLPEPPEQPVDVTLEISSSSHTTQDTSTSTAAIKAHVETQQLTLDINVKELKGEATKLDRKATISGTIEISGSGEQYAGVMMMLGFINKDVLEQNLAKSGIDWIEINKLDKTISNEKATIEFSITINVEKLAEYLENQEVTTKENYLEVYDESFIPSDSSVSLKLSVSTTTLNFEFSLDTTMSPTEILELIKKLQILRTPSVPTNITIPAAEEEEAMKMMKEYAGYLADTFEPLPSKASIRLELSPTQTIYTVVSPKIRAKGAETPADTLAALKEAVIKLGDIASKYAKPGEEPQKDIEKVLGARVTLEAGEEGIKISQTQTEFRNVDQVTVEVETTTTTPAGGGGISSTTMLGIIVAIIAIAVIALALTRK